ncbi:MAG: dTMP kinase [Chloroflexi bacterium]|nr:dTMP kinase [Chloroflexota bacterium]
MPQARRFITFEGPEGAGKSSQIAALADWLRQQGIEPVVTREPGGTPMGDRLREALFGARDHGALPLTEALLMNASRAQHVAELIRPALAAGRLVLCDRYADATLAYQGYGHGLDLGMLRQLIRIATGGLQPDLSILLDLPVEVGLARKRSAEQELNLMDLQSLEFHARVRDGYLKLAATDPTRWRIVDASAPATTVQDAIRCFLEPGQGATAHSEDARPPASRPRRGRAGPNLR